MSVVEGIDVSGWQHPGGLPINWAEVAKAGKRFAIVKATQGTTGLNSYLHADATGAAEAGLLVGVYHYAVPVQGDAALQAEWLVSACDGLTVNFGWWLDLETDGELQFYEVDTWAQEFLAALKEKGLTAGVYLDADYLARMAGAPWGFPLWLSFSAIPAGVKPTLHQGEPVTCAGIKGQVDPDVFLTYRGIDPPFDPAPAPGPQPNGDDVSEKLVQVAGEDAVYLVGGVPPVKYHVSPELETALIGFGTPKQVITQAEWLAAITEVGAGEPAAEGAEDAEKATEPETAPVEVDKATEAPEATTEAAEADPTKAATAESGEGGSEPSGEPSGPGEAEPAPVTNPGWQ